MPALFMTFVICFKHINVGVHKPGARRRLVPPAELCTSVCVVLSVSDYEKLKNKLDMCTMVVARGQEVYKRDSWQSTPRFI
jgi:hypothetical protein